MKTLKVTKTLLVIGGILGIIFVGTINSQDNAEACNADDGWTNCSSSGASGTGFGVTNGVVTSVGANQSNIENSNNDTSTAGDAGSYTQKQACSGSGFTTVTMPDGTKFVKSTSGHASLNCCREDHINCVRWICGSSSDFSAAWDNGHRGIGYSDETVNGCKNSSSQVCWAGRILENGGFDVWNEQNITRKSNLGNTYNIGSGMGMSSETAAKMNAKAAEIGATQKGLAIWCDEFLEDELKGQVEDPVSCGPLALGGNQTGVISGVRKESNDSYNWDDWGWVWARPGENVRFHDCYYSGLQNMKDKMVTPSNKSKSTYEKIGWKDDCYEASCVLSYEHPAINVTLPAHITLKQDADSNRGGWKDNGYNIAGIISDSETFDNDAAAKAYHYRSETSDATYLVSPDDVGKTEGELHQTITSKFRNSITTILLSVDTPSWPCYEYDYTYMESFSFSVSSQYGTNECSTKGGTISWNTPTAGSTVMTGTCEGEQEKRKYGKQTCTSDPVWTDWSESGHAEHTSGIRVPYNYENYGEALFDDSVIYSGEKTPQVWGWAINSPRYNPLTRGTYATKAPNSQWGLVGYIQEKGTPGSLGDCSGMEYCEVYASGGGTLNPSGNLDGDRLYIGGGVYDLWDVEAGNHFCSTVMVTSQTSGAYNNLEPEGDGVWYVASPNCRVISKKPTFQIRGGFYIENGTITQGKVSTKNNIDGWIGFDAYRNGTDGNGTTRNFYSWVDQNLTIGRQASLTNFSSGAAANFKKDNGGTDVGGIYAFDESQFRSRRMQPLTLPTPPVSPANSLKGIGAILNSSFRTTVVNSIVAKSGASSTCNIDGLTAYRGERRIIYCDGTLTINGDVLYKNTDSSASFSSLYDVPSVIIYAKNGINIGANATTIDAWIITDGTVNTCTGGDSECNRPLTINGTVLAHSIELKRTYGAGAGYKSSYPAELFNLSSSAFMYSAAGAKEMNPNAIQTVYTRELAPRY